MHLPTNELVGIYLFYFILHQKELQVVSFCDKNVVNKTRGKQKQNKDKKKVG